MSGNTAMDRETLDKWQGIEHEFRVGISTKATELYRYARYYHIDEIINALEEYTFFDGVPAICSKLQRRNDGFLRNGSRIYVCTGGHLEIATPECRNAFEVLKYDKASELYIQIGSELASEKYENKINRRNRDSFRIQCWKANVEIDKRYSRGTHESYLAERKKFAGKESLLIPFLVLRKIFCGAGGFIFDRDSIRYVVSPKAMVSRRVLTESPSQWPILSTRDEPLSKKEYMRVHVTSGEGVRSEVTRLINNAITSYVIEAIEVGKIRNIPEIWNPLQTFKDISQNINGDWHIRLASGERMGAIDYLNSYYVEAIEELFSERETSYWDEYALDVLKNVLDKLNAGLIENFYLIRRIEWIMKLWVIKNKLDSFEYEYSDGKARARRDIYKVKKDLEKEIAASFAFTNLCEYDLYEKIADEIGVERLLTEEDIGEALLSPPKNSRAELRVKLAEEFKDANISWNKITITREPRIRRPSEEEYSQLFSRYPELARMPSVVVVFLGGRGERGSREILVQLLAEDGDIQRLEEHIRNEIRCRIRNPYFDYLLYSGSKTYRFDELDGWNEETIRKKIESIKEEERRSEEAEEESNRETRGNERVIRAFYGRRC